MTRPPEVDEDAIVFLLPHAGASHLAGDPVFEGRLREALRHAMEEVPEADLRRCIIRTLSGDQYGEAEIRHLYGEHVRPA